VTAAPAETLAPFPRERSWLIPALQALQHAGGYLSPEALAAAAAHLRVPASEVHGVATGYPEFRLAPRGRHHVRVCTGVSCRLTGGEALLHAVEQRSRPGELTVEPADCFFACSMAPLVEVDGELHGRVGEAGAAALARWFRDEPSHAPWAGVLPRPPSPPAPALGGESAEAARAALVAAAHARRRARPGLRLVVQAGTCGRAVGALDVLEALRAAVARGRVEAEVVEGACSGACWAAPAVGVERAGAPALALERVEASAVDRLLDLLAGGGPDLGDAFAGVVFAAEPWRGLTPASRHPFWAGQERVLLGRAGRVDPGDLDDALVDGAYRALARALDGPPERVIAEVKASGLQGRGGAFFPAALKWEACRRAAGEPKYLVMNGEEGEPGIFKDRHLMEGDPHRVLEGVLLAAYASGASRAILYVHGEAELGARRLARAIEQAEAAGIAGPRLLGREVECRLELRRGAGGFVLGEETALLESLEGRRPQPRTRPPFPVESGLWGRPTVINNVETLSAVPAIVEHGAERFAALGTAKAPGTKLFGLSGPIRRPGVVEVRSGVTLRALLETIGGGLAGGRPFLGAVVGGPSGVLIEAARFDVPMEPRGEVSPGTGGIAAVPEGAAVLDLVRVLLAFNAAESCGKCTPCREGAPRLLALLDEIRGGAGGDAVRRAQALAETMQLASLCGLGQAAPLALLRALAPPPSTLPETA
jgi:NADH:ubiquinone oxidoreductase subunit F (NADH-binding)/NADH:ubiquinone oxidoreductase subunit E